MRIDLVGGNSSRLNQPGYRRVIARNFYESIAFTIQVGAAIADIGNIGCIPDNQDGGDSRAHISLFLAIALVDGKIGGMHALGQELLVDLVLRAVYQG